MEQNLIVIPNKSRPPLSLLPHSSTHFECHRIHASSINVSVTKRPHPKLVDAHLNQLCINGPLSEAVAILDSMAQQGSKVRPLTYMNLLQSCIDKDCILVGRELHARIGIVGNVDPFVETKLVSMYAKCGHLEEARKVFDEMRERNLFTWSAMIGACARDRSWEEVMDLFYDMMRDGVLPDEFLIPKIVQACGKCQDIETVKLIHSLVIRCGMRSSMRVNNSILAVYAKYGDMNCAKMLFKSMDMRDSVAWNAIITGFCQKGEIKQAQNYFDAMQEKGIDPSLVTWNILIASYNQLGHCDIAMNLMRKMESFGITPDVYTWTSMISGFTQKGRIYHAFNLLKEMFIAGIEPNSFTIASAASACASLKSIHTGLEIHSVAVKMGLVDDVLIGNSLIDIYSKCGSLEDAQSIFDKMLRRDVYSWNSIIGGYIQSGFCSKAHELFMKMQESDSPPNIVTWNVMITGYMQNGDDDRAYDLFQRIEKDGKIKPNTASWNSLISGYLQSGQKDRALQMFRKMQSFRIAPNSVTMLSILPACANLLFGKKVKEIHCCAVRRNLVSELSVSNIFIDTYAKSGNILYSRSIFDGLSLKDIISWNSLIAGYVLHGCSVSALGIFYQMGKEGLQPRRGTFASIISAFGHAGMVDEGKKAFSSLSEEFHIIPGVEHYIAMVNLFGRSGKLAEALELIQNMPFEPNSFVWGALLTASRIHRKFGLAILAGERMLQLEPGNTITQHLLSQAYSLCGKSWEAPKFSKLGQEKAAKKPVGQCWIEKNNLVYTFVVGDQPKTYLDKLHSWLKRIASFEDSAKKPESVGPWGGSGGSHWDDGVYSGVRQLVIAHGAGVDSIQIEYDKKGCSIWSMKHGGNGGHKTDKVNLDYPEEFLTSIHGYQGSLTHWGANFVRSLSFQSNKKTYGPFGVQQGTQFSIPMTGVKIVGFHGRCGWYLDAIGVYVKPLKQPNPHKTLAHSNNITNTTEDFGGYSIIHGSVGQNYDIVLALKQKDNFSKPIPNNVSWNTPEPNNFKHREGKISDIKESIKFEHKEKKISDIKEPNNYEHKEKKISDIKEPNNFEHKEKISHLEKSPSKVKGAVTYKAWGGVGGYTFDDGSYTGIRQINLSRNVGIVWIRVLYDFEGETIWGSKQGGTGGFKHDKIVFDFPHEVLTHITGYYGSLMYMGPETIRSLTFHTNRRKYGPFGDEQGTYFTTKQKEGKIIGIHGRKGLFLDAIGVHVLEGKVIVPSTPCKETIPRETSTAENDSAQWPTKLVLAKPSPAEEVSYGVMKAPAPCGPGPWGGEGGRPWDDGVFSGIQQIYLTKRPEGICSIQIEYDRSRQSVWSVKHGGTGNGGEGETMHRIKLEDPHEVLTCISGYYGSITKDEKHIIIIKSLTFYTSRGQYGPYGEEVGKYFTSNTTEGKVVGFHGRSSLYLDAIGVHMQHWLGSNKTSRSLFKLF
ncbi:hypothetical protein TanjilG_24029 [Lupinus angustifolius]|uniref:Mannose/glucose-specific lectin n=1 Tax=Lupinus angustifolius TaxID=3871 RepID=A0A1J7H7Y2_LUPAN|nr:hypothetical protein TanjilG_24029 [Lupinus angustifolius]